MVTASRGEKKSILLFHPKVPFVTWSSNKFSYSFFLNLKKIKAILVSSPQIQALEQRADGELCWAAGWPLNSRQSGPEGQDAGGVSAKAGAAGPACSVFRGPVRPTMSPWGPWMRCGDCSHLRASKAPGGATLPPQPVCPGGRDALMWQQVPAPPRPGCADPPSLPVSAVHGPGEDGEQLSPRRPPEARESAGQHAGESAV